MPHPRFTNEEIARRGEEIYASRLRGHLGKEHKGEVVIIDIESGEYEIGHDSLAANKGALAKCPGAALYGIRVGFPFVENISGLRLSRQADRMMEKCAMNLAARVPTRTDMERIKRHGESTSYR